MNTRQIDREGFTWTLITSKVEGHQPYRLSTLVKRGKEFWATAKLKHNGDLRIIPVLPTCEVPASILSEIRKDMAKAD